VIRLFLTAAVAALMTAGLACCGLSPASVRGSAAPAATSAAPTPSPVALSPAPSPVSTQATVAGTCAAGIDDVDTGMFYSMASLLQGGGGPGSGDEEAEAYQLTLTDTSSSATRRDHRFRRGVLLARPGTDLRHREPR
jgi:hypothetical protein